MFDIRLIYIYGKFIGHEKNYNQLLTIKEKGALYRALAYFILGTQPYAYILFLWKSLILSINQEKVPFNADTTLSTENSMQSSQNSIATTVIQIH